MYLADFASSAEAFARATARFFEHLSDVHWTPFALALCCLAAMQLARAWAWRNVLRAAYPDVPIPFPRIAAAYLAGAGINAILPAHAGDVTKVFLAKRQIPGSSYPAVTSSFLVQTVFDTTVGVLVLLYAVTQGLLPKPPQLPALPAFELSFWAEHPQVFAIVTGVLLLAIAIGVYYLGHHVRRFWERVRQGVVILSTPRRYLREVAAWQGIGWLLRFAAFWLFLEAFGIGGSVGNVLLVMSVQAIANVVPFTPGGAGAQQALLVATLHGPSRTAVLSFSVGTQIAMAAWSIVLGFAAMVLVFRTTDWRGLIEQAEEDRGREGDVPARA
jgi:glycosyltransferase 2 family protein